MHRKWSEERLYNLIVTKHERKKASWVEKKIKLSLFVTSTAGLDDNDFSSWNSQFKHGHIKHNPFQI